MSQLRSSSGQNLAVRSSNSVGSRRKSLSTERLKVEKPTKKNLVRTAKSKQSLLEDRPRVFGDFDLSEISRTGDFHDAFDKFWKNVTSGMDKHPQVSLPRKTPVDEKISEIQKRIKLNRVVLQSANERIKNISFNVERQNLAQWKDEPTFANLSPEEANQFKDMNALDLELEKLREMKPDRKVFLKSSPGIADFHKTMECTLSLLDKIQNSNEFNNYDKSCREIKREFHLDVIKPPHLVVSDEE